MRARLTPLLLGIVILLLAAHLLHFVWGVKSRSVPGTDVLTVLRAHEIQLVDDQGRTVAQLHVGEDGSGNLRLRSGDGVVRVKLGGGKDGSALILFDKETEPAVRLTVDETGTSMTLAQEGKPNRVIAP